MSEILGLIGAGRMGLPICRNLVRAGFTMVAGDADPERRSEVEAAGATWAAGNGEVAAAADVLITVLPGSDELRAAMATSGPAMRAGKTWIDMTSSSPAVAAELREPVHARDITCLEAPMGGGIAAAQTGDLTLFLGGEAAHVERQRTLLEKLGTIHHMGANGSGYITKLLVNLLWFGQAVATGEALLLASRSGIDLGLLRETLGASAARSEFIERDLGSLLDGDYLRSFGLDRCCEELNAVADLASGAGVPFELSRHVGEIYGQALARFGPVDGELLPVALLEERAGIRLRRAR